MGADGGYERAPCVWTVPRWCCAASEPGGSAELVLWPQGARRGSGRLVLHQTGGFWSVIWVACCLAVLVSPVCPQTKAGSTSAIKPAQVQWSEGRSCFPGSLATGTSEEES